MLTYKYLKYKYKYIKKKNIDNDKLNLLNNNDNNNVKLNLIGGYLSSDMQLFKLFTNLKCWEPNFKNDYQESQQNVFSSIEKLINKDIPQFAQLLLIQPSIQQLSITPFDIEQYETTISNLKVNKDNLLITILPYYEYKKENDCELNNDIESKCNNFAITL